MLIDRRTALASIPAVAATRVARAAPRRGGTMTVVLQSEPTTLISAFTVLTWALSVSAKVVEGLLDYDNDINPKPSLATTWDVSPDGLTYRFGLRPGVLWHDGKPFTSADVAFSILLLKRLHPRGRSTFANVSAVETPDALTAILRL